MSAAPAVFLLLCLPGAAADSLASALSTGRFQDALRMADSLLKSHPRDARLWTAKGLALSGLARDKESIASFDRALQLDQNFLPALKGASEAAYRSRDPRAATYLGSLLRLEPTSGAGHAMAAVLAFEANDCRGAVEHFEKSRGQVSGNDLASSQFGHCLLELGRPEEAVRVFESLLLSNPAHSNARYNLAVAQLQARQPAAAITTLGPLFSSIDPGMLNLLAAAQVAAGKIEAAISSLRQAARMDPRDERNYLDLAILCQKHDSLDVAREVLDVGLRNIPASARLHAMRGALYAQMAEFDKATADFDRAAELQPDQAYASMGLSVLLSQTGRVEGATKLLREKLAFAPHDPTLNYLLADSLLREGVTPQLPGFSDARDALQRAIRAKPDFARAHAALGTLYLRQGDAGRAAQELETALRLDPDSRVALSQLMTAWRKMGREQEATAVANRLRLQYEKDLQVDSLRQRIRIAK